jgi:hypothetical protein
VSASETGRASSSKLHEARLKRWINSVNTVTLPLLAGFSITSVVVVSDDAGNFQLPGATILALSCVAGLVGVRACPGQLAALDARWRTTDALCPVRPQHQNHSNHGAEHGERTKFPS